MRWQELTRSGSGDGGPAAARVDERSGSGDGGPAAARVDERGPEQAPGIGAAGAPAAADPIRTSFLRHQLGSGMALAEASDLLELFPMWGDPPDHYLARFRCKGLVERADGVIAEAADFAVGIHLPIDYLRRAESVDVVTWLGPPNGFHPNVRPPFICLGHLVPGTPLVDLLYQLFEIVSWASYNPQEHDALNRKACAWARQNPGRLPVDRRPLKRRRLQLSASEVER